MPSQGLAREPVNLGHIDRWLRLLGFCTWAFHGVSRLLAPSATDALGDAHGRAWVLPWLLFGVAFVAESFHRRLPRILNLFLLGSQTALALLFSIEGLKGFEGLTLAIVAVQVPTVLSLPSSVLWTVAQIIPLLATVVRDKTPLEMSQICGAYSAFCAFALLAYWLHQREQQAREELAGSHARLVTTRGLVIDQARQAERSRMSRELHDSLGHQLTTLSIQLQLAQKLAVGPNTEPLNHAQDITRAALREVRRVVSGERTDEEFDLLSTLHALAAGIPEPVIRVEAKGKAIGHDLGTELGPVFFRCIQEAVTNSLKHAGAKHIDIELQRTEGELAARIRDDGRGQASFVPGHGLRGIEQRMAEVGGVAHFVTKPGLGFEVSLQAPLSDVSQ
jgi:signal transduction histidine kinase